MVKVEIEEIGTLNNHKIQLFTLNAENRSFVSLLNYGATIVSVNVPDKEGCLGNVVLGFPSFQGYLQDECYIGSTIGRFANRIGNASFEIDGKTYLLDRNDGIHINHGGFKGFNTKVFDAEIDGDGIVFSSESEDGEGGFPGNLKFSVRYTWTEGNELSIKYQAETDRKTAVNFTNHAYFNLSALRTGGLEQLLQINASRVLECTPDFIPTGRIIPTERLTFRNNPIGEKMNWQAESFQGINSYYIFDLQSALEGQCCLVDEKSGRKLEIFTTYPGVQLYTGDYLKSKVAGHHGSLYQSFDGICLECQHYPDSPNHSGFPLAILSPEEHYYEEIIYKFGVT